MALMVARPRLSCDVGSARSLLRALNIPPTPFENVFVLRTYEQLLLIVVNYLVYHILPLRIVSYQQYHTSILYQYRCSLLFHMSKECTVTQ